MQLGRNVAVLVCKTSWTYLVADTVLIQAKVSLTRVEKCCAQRPIARNDCESRRPEALVSATNATSEMIEGAIPSLRTQLVQTILATPETQVELAVLLDDASS